MSNINVRFVYGLGLWSSFTSWTHSFSHFSVAKSSRNPCGNKQKVKANHRLMALNADFVLWIWRFPPTTSGCYKKNKKQKKPSTSFCFRLSADCCEQEICINITTKTKLEGGTSWCQWICVRDHDERWCFLIVLRLLASHNSNELTHSNWL